TRAVPDGSGYRVTGRKVWTTKALESERVLLLTRTTPADECARRTDGLTLFVAPLKDAAVTIRPIPKLGRNAVASCEASYDGLCAGRLRGPLRGSGRRGGRGGPRLLLPARRAERRTGPDRRRGAGHRPGGAAPRGRLRPPAHRVRPSHRPEPGRRVPSRRGAR